MDARSSAYELAVSAHAGQEYRSGVPYLYHVASVVTELLAHGHHDKDIIDAGWLHDVVEDTPVSIEQIQMDFSHRTADAVWAVTGVGNNRKERNKSAYSKIRECRDGLIVKLADRIVNVRESQKGRLDLLEMYTREYPQFRDELYVADVATASMWIVLNEVFYGR